MRATTALSVGLVLLATACAASEPGTPAAAPAPVTTSVRPTPTPTPTPTAPPRTAADGTDLSACADGKCEVRVDGPAEIPVPPGDELRAVRLEQDGAGLRLVVLGPDGFRAGGSGGGTVRLAEGAVVTFEDIGGGSVIVTIDAG